MPPWNLPTNTASIPPSNPEHKAHWRVLRATDAAAREALLSGDGAPAMTGAWTAVAERSADTAFHSS